MLHKQCINNTRKLLYGGRSIKIIGIMSEENPLSVFGQRLSGLRMTPPYNHVLTWFYCVDLLIFFVGKPTYLRESVQNLLLQKY